MPPTIMTTTTDTPRTDAEIWDVVYHHKNEIVVDADFARELERELAEYITENIRLWKIADAQMELEAEVERLGGLLYETRSLLTEFFDCVDIGGLHDGDCNISTEDPEKWDLGCNCTTAYLKRKYIKLYSK